MNVLRRVAYFRFVLLVVLLVACFFRYLKGNEQKKSCIASRLLSSRHLFSLPFSCAKLYANVHKIAHTHSLQAYHIRCNLTSCCGKNFFLPFYVYFA